MKHLFILLFISYPLFSFQGGSIEQTTVTGTAGHYSDPDTMLTEGESLLKEGDLVVRLNRDPTSQYIKNFNRHDKNYSHAGIVLFENGYPYIFHIVNGEENPDEKLRKDSLSHFCNPRKNAAYGIYRYDMNSSEIKMLKVTLQSWYEKGIHFDPVFDPNTDDRMYCSEMIRKALIKATSKRILIETTKLTATEAKLFSAYTHLPLAYTSSLRIVSIDDLYTNRFCHIIRGYNYDK